MFPALLEYLTVQVSDVIPRPQATSGRCAGEVVPLLRTYPVAQGLGGRVQRGEEVYSLAILLQEEGLLDRTDLRHRYQSACAARGRVWRVRRVAGGGFTENHAAPAPAARCRTTTRLPMAAWCSTRAARTWCSPTTAWPPTACSPKSIWCRAAMCSHLLRARPAKPRPWGCSASRCATGAFLGLGSKESLRFSAHTDAFDDFVPQDRIYRKKAGL